jgi:hypothetical protein
VVVYLHRCPYLLNHAVLLDNNPIAHGHGLSLVMGHVYYCCLEPVMEFRKLCPHLNSKLGVEV